MPPGADLHPAAADGRGDGGHRLVLADDVPLQHVLQVRQLLQLVLLDAGGRDARPQLDDLGHVLLLHVGKDALAFQLVQALLQGGDAVVGLGQLLVIYLAVVNGAGEVLLPVLLLGQGQFGLVVLLQLLVAQGRAGAGLVQQVDGLVRQVAVVDVPLSQHHHAAADFLGNLHPVVALIIALDAQQNLDSVLHRGLRHGDRLEPALQGRVLLNVFAVFVEGGGADDLNLPPGEGGL